MDFMNFSTPDQTLSNIEKIGELFPSVITEMRDEKGNLKKGINFETLKQLLSPDVVDSEERYEFTWVGKKVAMAEAARPITKTLRPVKEDSRDWETTENLYIEGDNLEALKILQESYLGKVKMIYIDPPYNTGKDFVYPDRYMMDDEEHKEKTNYFDEDGNVNYSRINSESDAKYHSDWCNMMYSRLMIARNVLKDDGVLFISIDYHELNNLKNICNEVFGESNFVGEIIWQTATDNNATQISMEHEYVICYARAIENLSAWNIPSNNAKKIELEYNSLKDKYGKDIESIRIELKKWIHSHKDDLKGVSHYTYVDEIGVFYPGNSIRSHIRYVQDLNMDIDGQKILL